MSSLRFQWVPRAEIFDMPISSPNVSKIEQAYVISAICELNPQRSRSSVPLSKIVRMHCRSAWDRG